jgi:hypothetical protein
MPLLCNEHIEAVLGMVNEVVIEDDGDRGSNDNYNRNTQQFRALPSSNLAFCDIFVNQSEIY